MATCKSCGARVFWLLTNVRKRMAIDWDPVRGGNVQIVESGGYREARVVEAEPGVLRHRAHFASCPAAKELRRKGPLPAERQADLFGKDRAS